MQSGVHTRAAGTEARPFDVGKLFATSCGWCHSSGGREAGKGPRLMGTELTDEQIVTRIRNGKTGQMPAFGGAFNDDEMRAIVQYIRNLNTEPPGDGK
jgi:mono/diheme cytochrome c family protein